MRNTDASPTKSYLTDLSPDDAEYRFYSMSFGKRPEEELYDMRKDPDCIMNLAGNPEYKSLMARMRKQMEEELTEQGDPRTLGLGDIFDEYKYEGKPFNYDTGEHGPLRKPKQP